MRIVNPYFFGERGGETAGFEVKREYYTGRVTGVGMPRPKVLLAEDHKVVAEALRELLADCFELVAVVHDGRALVKATEELCPDVIVTDISMPLLNGLDAIRQLLERRPRTRVVVLTMHQDRYLAAEAFRSGVCGYVLKVSPAEELVSAIREAAEGRAYVSSLITDDLDTLLIEAGRGAAGKQTPLTPRQREVLQLIAEGRTMKEAAAILNISPRTAESHKYEIMQALGVQTIAELVQCAIRMKLIPE
jgi:DNA-binding NarL/FixJ family response regulator